MLDVGTVLVFPTFTADSAPWTWAQLIAKGELFSEVCFWVKIWRCFTLGISPCSRTLQITMWVKLKWFTSDILTCIVLLYCTALSSLTSPAVTLCTRVIKNPGVFYDILEENMTFSPWKTINDFLHFVPIMQPCKQVYVPTKFYMSAYTHTFFFFSAERFAGLTHQSVKWCPVTLMQCSQSHSWWATTCLADIIKQSVLRARGWNKRVRGCFYTCVKCCKHMKCS